MQQEIARARSRSVDADLIAFRWRDSQRAAAAGITNAEIMKFRRSIVSAARWAHHRYRPILQATGNEFEDVVGMAEVWAWNYLGNWRRGSDLDDSKLLYNQIKQRAGAWAEKLSKRWSPLNGASSTNEMRGRVTRYLANPEPDEDGSSLEMSRTWLRQTPATVKIATKLATLGHTEARILLLQVDDEELAGLAGRLIREIDKCTDDTLCSGCRARNSKESSRLSIPQADRLPLVRAVSEQVARGEGLMTELVPKYEDRPQSLRRSIHQYRSAAEILELLKTRGTGLQPTRYFWELEKTEEGSAGEKGLLLERVQNAKALRPYRWFLDPQLVTTAYARWLDGGGNITKTGLRALPAGFARWPEGRRQVLLDELAMAEQEHNRLTSELATGAELSFATADRRAGTLRSWRRELAGT